MPHVYKEFLMLLGLAVVLICFALCIRHKVRCWNAEFRQKVDSLMPSVWYRFYKIGSIA